MSHDATNWAFRQPGLSPSQKLVLLCLADCHNPSQGCFPSQAYIAEVANVSRATVNRCLDELERAKLIRRESGKDDVTHRQRPTRYYLAFEDAPEAVSHSAKAVSQNDEKPCLILQESRVSKCDTNPVIDNQVKRTRKADEEPAGFAEAFEAYPHYPPRRNRKDALRAFRTLPPAEQKTLINAVKSFKDSLKPRDMDFVKGMGPWLRDGLHRNYSAEEVPKVDRAVLIRAYRLSGTWQDTWGPRPTPDELETAA